MKHSLVKLYPVFCIVIFTSVSIVTTKGTGIDRSDTSLRYKTEEEHCHVLDANTQYWCPPIRYCLWSFYPWSTRRFLTKGLGYSQLRWNLFDINPIELVSFANLTDDEQNTLQVLGYDEERHDCCNGHYEGYDWADFDGEDDDEVRVALEKMGYNQERWDNGDGNGGDGGLYENLFWDQLSPEVQEVAYDVLCYNSKTWDGFPLTIWPEDEILPGSWVMDPVVNTTDSPTINPTDSPTTNPTANPTENPTKKPTKSLTSNPTSIPEDKSNTNVTVTDSSVSDSTENPSSSPSWIPSKLPSHAPSNGPSKEPSPSPTKAPTKEPSPSPTKDPTKEPSKEPSPSPTKSPTKAPSPSPTKAPTGQPSPSPTHVPSTSPSESLPPVVALIPKASEGVYCRGSLNPNVDYFCPVVRYCPWTYYHIKLRMFYRNSIGYTLNEWNYMQVPSPVDATSYDTHPLSVQDSLRALGYDDDSHDCCNNHYADYDWADFDLAEGYGSVLTTFQALGYTQTLWDSGASVVYDDFWWDELPLQLQTALYDHLCYSRELWNQSPMSTWPSDAIVPGMD